MRHAWRGATETTAALKAYLATATSFYMVELYDLTLRGLGYPTPLTFRWTDQMFDVPFWTPPDPVTVAPAIYAGATHLADDGVTPAPSPRITRSQRKEVIGIEVDSLTIDLLLDGTDLLAPADGDSGTPRFGLAEAIKVGLFDGATLFVRRLVLPAPPRYPLEPTSIDNRGDLGPGDTSLGAVTEFGGFVANGNYTRSRATLEVKSAAEKLQVGVPVRIYQASCPWDLFGRMCGVDPDGAFGGFDFSTTARVSSQANTDPTFVYLTTSYPTDTMLTHPADYFRFGTLQFTSGVLAGLRFAVLAFGPVGVDYSFVRLVKPMPRMPAPGDDVVLRAGCAKTEDDCANKFGNFVNGDTEVIDGDTYHTDGTKFGGQPRVPPPDSAV